LAPLLNSQQIAPIGTKYALGGILNKGIHFFILLVDHHHISFFRF
jgi:hypothetical protein